MPLAQPEERPAAPLQNARAHADAIAAGTFGFFDYGPPLTLNAWLRPIGPGQLRLLRRVATVIAIGWLPLLLLATLEGNAWHADGGGFLNDHAVQARSLVAATLLVLGEATCAPWLTAIASQFVTAGFIGGGDRPAFTRAVAATREALRSRRAVIAILLIAYASTIAIFAAVGLPRTWLSTFSGTPSLAGWWHLQVSAPLLLALLLGWVWRAWLWGRFLMRVAQIELKLAPTHPDRVAGLGFVGHSLRAFAVPAFAMGTIVAGAIANAVQRGGSPFAHGGLIAASLTAILLLFTAPLLAFSRRLLGTWHRGVLRYGATAAELGRKFERAWIGKHGEEHPPPDPSTTADLNAVVANVYAMRVVPVDVLSLVALAAAALSPLLPVLLLTIPLDQLLADIKGLLF
ncbi:hypothetical protein VW23_005890 [Devosia insulae DS-56]|uniref:Uncharacterized protein n=1 Tax=Devosia insulae DS-56 TaxID=1116389 RepID=A0A1E5XHV7_9HYPH|nr:hypothetical protein [Devosia insulae]OEO28188.1 hypothetical protein VW23_005890 [Devosia insulae DS-56]